MKMSKDSINLRLLLIGKTGSGKSITGNMIFNDSVFESRISSSSVTRVSQAHTASVNNRSVMVVDTPDFRFSTHTDFDSDSELKRALQLCAPGAHVILLFLPLRAFTQQDQEFIHWFEQMFGAEALRFTLVLFTHADKRHRRPLGEMIRRNTQLSDFINRCGRRYHEFNIKAPANRRQVTELMEKVERLVSDNSYSCYTLEMMEEEEKRRKEKEKGKHQKSPDKDIKEHQNLNIFIVFPMLLIKHDGLESTEPSLCINVNRFFPCGFFLFMILILFLIWKNWSMISSLFARAARAAEDFKDLLKKMWNKICKMFS